MILVIIFLCAPHSNESFNFAFLISTEPFSFMMNPILSPGARAYIPWNEKYGIIRPGPPKYSEMSYCNYIPENLLDSQVLISPDFENCTYASTTYAPARANLRAPD